MPAATMTPSSPADARPAPPGKIWSAMLPWTIRNPSTSTLNGTGEPTAATAAINVRKSSTQLVITRPPSSSQRRPLGRSIAIRADRRRALSSARRVHVTRHARHSPGIWLLATSITCMARCSTAGWVSTIQQPAAPTTITATPATTTIIGTCTAQPSPRTASASNATVSSTPATKTAHEASGASTRCCRNWSIA